MDLMEPLMTNSDLPEGLLSVSSHGWAYLYWYPAEVMGSAVGQDQTV